MSSELQMMREYEQRRARKQRGGCRNCGHNWQPRNPNPTVNRCPGCGMRGVVSYSTLDDQPGSGGTVEEIKAAATVGERRGCRGQTRGRKPRKNPPQKA